MIRPREAFISILICITMLLVIFSAIGKACAGEKLKLRTVEVKGGDCNTMAAGWRCYDTQSVKELDRVLKRAVECEELLAAPPLIAPKISVVKFYQTPLFKVGVGTALGLLVGVTVGMSF